ncbi:MATE family efflux transporter [Allobaculum stercoricanis]|uniref:MATE family efflux transporter n=1 Tax=Allobaculum stercoricanis TaxID=174709 RepID=UPI00037C8D89|nr:MATE family efflux transporter [Allobaculum stercoricanis]
MEEKQFESNDIARFQENNKKNKARGMDMVEGSLWKKVFLFALPLGLTGVLQQLFNAADIAVVGQFTGELGAHCMAAVGACTSLISLLVNVFIGISIGSNVVIANAVGANNDKRVKRTCVTSIWVALIGGLFVTLVGELISGPVLKLMGVPAEVFDMANLYIKIYLMGMPIILLYNFEAAIMRGIGNTKLPLFALSLAGVINVILNMILVIGFHMTVEGVAIATVFSNLISSIILFIYLRKDKLISFHSLFDHPIHGDILVNILRIGIPSGIQSSVFSIANVVIQSGFNSLGTIIMASSSASLNVESVVYSLVSSFGHACTTFTGANYGANKIQRCKQVLMTCLLLGLGVTFVSAGSVMVFGRSLVSLFNGNPEVIAQGYVRLVVMLSSYVFVIHYEVISGYLRGFGISVLPAAVTTLGVCVVRIFWIFVVFPMNPTYHTILAVFPISLGLTAFLMIGALFYIKPATKRQKAQAK